MATRIYQRCSFSTFKSALSKSPSSIHRSAATRPSVSSTSPSSPLTRFSLTRSRVELGSAASMLPLHSAVAQARMTSCLSSSSTGCRALSQDKTDGT